jgi:hypothetical protein
MMNGSDIVKVPLRSSGRSWRASGRSLIIAEPPLGWWEVDEELNVLELGALSWIKAMRISSATLQHCPFS